MNDLLIETRNLSKTFHSKAIVSDINMRVEKGSIYGFLGANGAGKSTTMKMLLGLLRPTSGEISIFGKNLSSSKKEVLRLVGSMIEMPAAYPNLTARENMRFAATLLGMPKKRIEECLKIVNLNSDADKKVKEYSMGMKQRLGIAISLLHDPQLLILDEPVNGLDPLGIAEMRKFIMQISYEFGVTVLLSSHLLAEINLMATHVGIIHDGSLIFQGTLEKLKEENFNKYHLKVNDPSAIGDIFDEGMVGEVTDEKEKKIRIYLKPEQDISEIINTLVNQGIRVYEICPIQVTLEDVFLRYTRTNGNLNNK